MLGNSVGRTPRLSWAAATAERSLAIECSLSRPLSGDHVTSTKDVQPARVTKPQPNRVVRASTSAVPTAMQQLQRTIGNRAVAQLVARGNASPARRGRSIEPPSIQRVTPDKDNPDRAHGRRATDLKDAVVIKVTIAGSGHNRWATHAAQEEAGGKGATRWSPKKESQKMPASYVRPKKAGGEITEISYAGPGASDSTRKSPLGGAQDLGSNRIANLIKRVPDQVLRLLYEINRNDWLTVRKRTVIMIRAHSRGSVAASQVAADLRKKFDGNEQGWPKLVAAGNRVEIELVLFDPVPGPAHKGSSTKLNLRKAGLSEFTIVYSVASGYFAGFGPQAVYGAKRIIISKQNHGAGKAKGFRYKNVVYSGSNLNSLPAGVYVDFNDKDSNTSELVKVATREEAQRKFYEAQRASGGRPDSRRPERIAKVLDDYFAHAPPPKRVRFQ